MYKMTWLDDIVFYNEAVLYSWLILDNHLPSGVETEGLSKMIGGALKMVYLLMGVAILGIVYTEFSKAFK